MRWSRGPSGRRGVEPATFGLGTGLGRHSAAAAFHESTTAGALRRSAAADRVDRAHHPDRLAAEVDVADPQPDELAEPQPRERRCQEDRTVLLVLRLAVECPALLGLVASRARRGRSGGRRRPRECALLGRNSKTAVHARLGAAPRALTSSQKISAGSPVHHRLIRACSSATLPALAPMCRIFGAPGVASKQRGAFVGDAPHSLAALRCCCAPARVLGDLPDVTPGILWALEPRAAH